MSVTPRGGSWQASFAHKGVRYRRSFPTELAAKQWEADSQAALLRGNLPDMGEQSARASSAKSGVPFTLGELFEWTNSTRWSLQKSSVTSVINAKTVLRILGSETPIRAIDRVAVGRMVAKLREEGAAVATINRKLSAYNTMMKEAVSLDIIEKVPKQPLFREAEGRIRRITPDEERMIIGYFALVQDQDMEDYVRLSLDTGLRQAEVLGLDDGATSDPTYVKVFGVDAKGKRSRAVPTTEAVRAIIQRRRAANPKGMLFPGLTADAVSDRWKPMRGALRMTNDPEFVPHALRHEFCSRLADLGVSAQIIQALAGHKDIKTTMRYIHLSPTALVAAINQLAIHKALDVNGRIQSPPPVAAVVPHAGHEPEAHRASH